MSKDRKMDFHYAVENTEIVLPPNGHLETFGNTIVNYTLVSESMDTVNQCRIRTGRMQLLRPQIITPSDYSEMLLEGFGEEARKYVEWLQEHNTDVHILRYGYTLKQEAFSEEMVTDTIEASRFCFMMRTPWGVTVDGIISGRACPCRTASFYSEFASAVQIRFDGHLPRRSSRGGQPPAFRQLRGNPDGAEAARRLAGVPRQGRTRRGRRGGLETVPGRPAQLRAADPERIRRTALR